MRRYKQSRIVVGNCRLLVTLLESKLTTVGAGLACFEIRPTGIADRRPQTCGSWASAVAPGVDINIKVAHPACLRSACLRPLRRGDAKWRLRPRLSLAKDVNATAVVGRAASLAEPSNRRATNSVAVLDDWRSEPTFLLNRAPAGHGRCAGSVKCA